MKDAVFSKAMENVRKYRDIKLVTTEKRKKEIFSNRTKLTNNKNWFKKLLPIEMKITQILMNRPVYFGLSILETSKK